MANEIKCDDCGACCQNRQALGSQLDPDNVELAWIKRNPDKVDVVEVEGHRPTGTTYLKSRECDGRVVCLFWTGTLGVTSNCGTYKDRPDMCSRFPVGSPDCIATRKALGLPTYGREVELVVIIPEPQPKETMEPNGHEERPEQI